MVILKRASVVVPFFVASVLLAACGNTGVEQQQQAAGNPESPGSGDQGGVLAVSGAYTALSGQRMELAQDGGKPTVLMFGSFICSECTQEANLYLNSLRNRRVAPSRVNLHTVMVGTTQDDAVQWRNTNPVPWSVGLDSASADLITQKCGRGASVPCTIVYVGGRPVLTRQGVISRQEIESYTGPWE